MESEIPPSLGRFKFDASRDQELILKYLEKKAKGEPLPPYEIPEVNLYGDTEPSELFNRGKTSGEPIFVFTKLTNKSTKRMLRTCGSGKWDGRTKASAVYAKGSDSDGRKILLGFKKLFTFAPRTDDDSDKQDCKNGHLNMVEYSLPDDKAGSGYVICKIQYKASSGHKRSRKPKSSAAEGDNNGSMTAEAKSSVMGKTKRTVEADEETTESKFKRMMNLRKKMLDAGEFMHHGPGTKCELGCFLEKPEEEAMDEEALAEEWKNAPPYARELSLLLLGCNNEK